MDRLGVRISRCSLALSLAVKLGLGAWLAIALLGGPTGSVALTPPAMQGLEEQTTVELTQSRKKKRRTRAARSRRELREQSEIEAHKAPEPSKEQTEKDAGAALKAGGAERSAGAKGGSGASSEATKAVPGGDSAAAGKASTADHQPAASEPEIKEQVWSDAEIIAALEDCVRLLAPIAAHVEVSKPIRSGQCGAPAAVVLRRVGATTPVEVSPPAVINCRMVARLHEWVEATLQPAARDLLKAPVTRIINASGYVCRNRNGSSQDKISEHAFANALDISALVTGDGRTIDVLTHWGKTEADLRAMALAKAEAATAKAAEKAKGKASAKDDRATPVGSAGKDKDSGKGVSPGSEVQQEAELQAKRGRGRKASEPVTSVERSGLGGGNPRPVDDARSGDASSVTTEGLFLRRLHKGACGLFGTVLGPEANEAHRNHFHVDLAARRRGAFCQ